MSGLLPTNWFTFVFVYVSSILFIYKKWIHFDADPNQGVKAIFWTGSFVSQEIETILWAFQKLWPYTVAVWDSLRWLKSIKAIYLNKAKLRLNRSLEGKYFHSWVSKFWFFIIPIRNIKFSQMKSNSIFTIFTFP